MDADAVDASASSSQHVNDLSDGSGPHSAGSPVVPDKDTAATSMLSLFRNAEFRTLTLTQFLSAAGDQFARVALSVLVFNRTNSAFQSAIAYALTFVPAAIGGPLLSGFADRRPRRSVMIFCDVVRAPLIGLIAIPGIPLPLAMVLLAVAGLFEAPFEAARGALLPDILHGERYTKGYAISQVTTQSAQVGGFGLAGVLLLALTPSTLLVIDAVSFVLSALLLVKALKKRPAVITQSESDPARWYSHVLSDAATATRLVMTSSTIRPLALLAWSACTFVISFEALGAPLARASGSASWTVGVLLASQPLGTVIGSIFAARTPEPYQQRTLRLLAVLALTPLVIGLARPPLAVLVLIGFVSGLGLSFNVLAVTQLVQRVPAEVRGRALGFVGSGLLVVQGLGVLLAGAVASLVDARLALGWLGVAGTLAVLAAVADGVRHTPAQAPAQP